MGGSPPAQPDRPARFFETGCPDPTSQPADPAPLFEPSGRPAWLGGRAGTHGSHMPYC